MEKMCSTCRVIQPLTDFYSDRKNKDGRSYNCKKCTKISAKKWHSENRERHKENCKRNYWKDPDGDKARSKSYREAHKQELKEYHKRWMEENRESRLAYEKARYAAAKGDPDNKWKRYVRNNRDKINARAKAYREANREKVRAGIYKWYLRKYKGDTAFRLLCNLRSRLWAAMNGRSKSDATKTLIGCTIPELMQHLESQFKDGMTWDNYGKWQVDHRVACANFRLEDPEQQRQCFHFSNLQPLWAEDNQSKGARL